MKVIIFGATGMIGSAVLDPYPSLDHGTRHKE